MMDGFRKKRWWRGPPARRLAVWATLALMVALPARLKAAEEGGRSGTFKLSCEGGTVTLKALDAPAPAVFLALAKKCGLLLEGVEYIPKWPVSANLQKVTMKEAVGVLIRRTWLSRTLEMVAGSSGGVILEVMHTRTPVADPTIGIQPKVNEGEVREAAAEAAVRQFLLGKTSEERYQSLKELRRLDPEKAGDLQEMDAEELADEQKEMGAAEARLQFLAAKSDEERHLAMEEMKRLDPEKARDLGEIGADQLPKLQKRAKLEKTWRKLLLTKTSEERQSAYEELKQIDPRAAKDLVEGD